MMKPQAAPRMSRPVSPWTWRRALRDHGPASRSVLLTLFTIGTFMNRDGYAFPGQQTIARGARASVRTVQRHIEKAEREGWIGVRLAGRGGQGWRHLAYRAAIPADLNLSYLDETIADTIEGSEGVIEGGDPIVSPPYTRRDAVAASVSPASSQATSQAEGLASASTRSDNKRSEVATVDGEGGDISDANVATQLCRTNSRSETPASLTHAPEEARYARVRILRPLGFQDFRTEGLGLNRPSPRELTDKQIRERLRKLREAGIDAIDDVLKQFATYDEVTVERVRTVVASHGASSLMDGHVTTTTATDFARTVQSVHG
jgi:hypothetical protein